MNERQNLIEKNLRLSEKLQQYIKLVSVLIPKYKVSESLLANCYKEEKFEINTEKSTNEQNVKTSKLLTYLKMDPKNEIKTKRRSRKKLIESVDDSMNLDLNTE
jgi:hypothetical protein